MGLVTCTHLLRNGPQKVMTASGLRELLAGDDLTHREIEVLSYASEGNTSIETGERLYLSPETIKVHRKYAVAKLDARNLTHAVALAIRKGLI